MDLLAEAEARAQRAHSAKREVSSQRASESLSPHKKLPQVFQDSSRHDAFGGQNSLPDEAKLAGIDYNWNGSRARSNTGEFVPPRWMPDEEAEHCTRCRTEFDWVNRRHHCRHCGAVVCHNCSPNRSLLPFEFGERDPQRVCVDCELELQPLQTSLTNTIANHQCANSIDVSGQCSGRYFNLPYANDLGAEIRKAAYSTHNLFNLDWVKDKAIPLQLLSTAKGVAYLTVFKVGMVIAPKLGTGCVVARLPDGKWSAPSAISTFGCNWGALVGADVTDYVIILNTRDAVDAFSGAGSVSIGAGVEIAAGPVGRAGGASFNVGTEGFAPALSYAHSRGAYAGIGLEGSVIVARSAVNFNFYGRELDPKDILRGAVPPPRAAQPLYDTLFHALSAGPAPIYTPKYSASMPVHLGESDSEPFGAGEMDGGGSDVTTGNGTLLRRRDNGNMDAANVKITRAATTPAKPVGGTGYSDWEFGKKGSRISGGAGDAHDHFDAALHTGGMFDIAL